MLKVIVVMTILLTSCEPRTTPTPSWIIIDRQQRNSYTMVATRSACDADHKSCVSITETTTHLEQGYFLLRNCDEHNECAYQKVYVTREEYDAYGNGMFYPKAKE